MDDFTRKFNLATEKDEEIHQILLTVYRALEEKGYNPINQIVGYILSEDPTNIWGNNPRIRPFHRSAQCALLFFCADLYILQKPCAPVDCVVFQRFPVISCVQSLTKRIKSVTIRLQLLKECSHGRKQIQEGRGLDL